MIFLIRPLAPLQSQLPHIGTRQYTIVYVVLDECKIILLSDLECDFLNTKQGCKRLNQVSIKILLDWNVNYANDRIGWRQYNCTCGC